jgi:hypothetical protein
MAQIEQNEVHRLFPNRNSVKKARGSSNNEYQSGRNKADGAERML